MPIYEYRCSDCAQIFEEWQKTYDEREVPCPICGSKAERLISNTSFVLKGSGWYVTDYCSRSSSGGCNGSETQSAETKAEPKAAEPATSKTDTASGGCAACAASSTGASSS